MRPAQKNNRSRGRGNRKSGGGGGNVVNRVYDSAGPEGKVRGTPQQIIEKYLSLARDAQTSGDRVMSENFLQHAEHYQRMLIQATVMQEQSRRESADAATDYDGDGPDTDSGQSGAAQPGHAHSGRSQPERQAPQQPEQPQQPRSEAAGAASGGNEIGGMTTIDSGREGEDLLIVSEEIAQSQPRRNGDGRRRRQKPSPPADAPEGESQPAPEAQPQSEN